MDLYPCNKLDFKLSITYHSSAVPESKNSRVQITILPLIALEVDAKLQKLSLKRHLTSCSHAIMKIYYDIYW
jgi:hypothetical protein